MIIRYTRCVGSNMLHILECMSIPCDIYVCRHTAVADIYTVRLITDENHAVIDFPHAIYYVDEEPPHTAQWISINHNNVRYALLFISDRIILRDENGDVSSVKVPHITYFSTQLLISQVYDDGLTTTLCASCNKFIAKILIQWR